MGSLYAEACKRLEENPDYENEIRATYSRWDQKDPEVVACWKETREWSLIGFREMYEKMDIKFDRYYFNSMFEESGKAIVKDPD